MRARFPTTQWSQVLAARDRLDAEAREALEVLCAAYWSPLYAYVRRLGHDPDSASDLTQAFFAHLLEAAFLRNVHPAKGRFRSFLLTSLRHFLSHEREKQQAKKRGGGSHTLSFDTDQAERLLQQQQQRADHLTPEELFERHWAMRVLERAMERLAAESTSAGKTTKFALLKQFLTGEEPRTSYRQAAATLRTSEGAVRTAVHRLRRRFGACLRVEIAATVASAETVDDEVRHLLTVVRLQ